MPGYRPLPVRVFLTSPRLLVRSALGLLLQEQPQIEMAGAAADLPPATVAFDLLLWDVAGIPPRALPFRFLVLLPDGRNARAWLAAGAAGTVLETSSLPELLDAIRQTARGDAYFPPALKKEVLDPALGDSSLPGLSIEPLTEREREVLRWLAQGLSNKDIAQKLYLSVRTVEGHLANIYGKLQVKSRIEAALWAQHNPF